MKETMGQIIKKLRKERNLTQEELAEQLNISAQSISKWENNTSMPDISFVVPLSNLFGVPTDVLFGVYGTNHEDEVNRSLEEIYEIYDGCKDGEEGQTALIILEKYRDALNRFPNNATILSEASSFGIMVLENNQTELYPLIGQKGIDELFKEITRWSELIVKYSPSTEYALSAKKRMIDMYVLRKNWDAAYALADTFPESSGALRTLLMADLKCDKGDIDGEKILRSHNIVMLSSSLGHQITMLGKLYMREGKYEEALYCFSSFRKIVDVIYADEAYRPPFMYDYNSMFRFPAECLVMLKREDAAIELLEEGVAFIRVQAENYNKKLCLSVPLLYDQEFGYGHDGKAEFGDLKGRLQRFVCADAFDKLRQYPRYNALLESISK